MYGLNIHAGFANGVQGLGWVGSDGSGACAGYHGEFPFIVASITFQHFFYLLSFSFFILLTSSALPTSNRAHLLLSTEQRDYSTIVQMQTAGAGETPR